MKKLLVSILFVSLIMLYNVQPTSASEEAEAVITKEVVHYERIYTEKGELKEENVLDKETYDKRVKEKKAELTPNKNKDMSFVADNVPKHSAAYEKFFVEEPESTDDSMSLMTTSSLNNSFEPVDGTSTSQEPEDCYFYLDSCEVSETLNTEYTTHTTTVTLKPNVFGPEPSIFLKTNLHWDIMPEHRMHDTIALSWEHGDKLAIEPRTMRADFDAHYEYYYKSAKVFENDHTSYAYGVSDSFTKWQNPFRFSQSEHGVVFHPDLSDYENFRYYIQNPFTMHEYIEMETYTDLDITLEVALRTRNEYSLLNNNIYEFEAVGEYMHFWESLNELPSLNDGIEPSSGFSTRLDFDSSHYSQYDGFRRNPVNVVIN